MVLLCSLQNPIWNIYFRLLCVLQKIAIILQLLWKSGGHWSAAQDISAVKFCFSPTDLFAAGNGFYFTIFQTCSQQQERFYILKSILLDKRLHNSHHFLLLPFISCVEVKRNDREECLKTIRSWEQCSSLDKVPCVSYLLFIEAWENCYLCCSSLHLSQY